MKCVNCGVDNKLKDRTANMGRCSNCNHQFAFEPTAMPAETRLTDPLFAKAIADLSANNTLFFTPRQLYYLLDKRLRSRFGLVSGSPGGFTIVGIFISVFLSIWCAGFFRTSFGYAASIIFSIFFALAILQLSRSSLAPKFNRRTRQKNLKTLKILAAIVLLGFLPIGIFASLPIALITAPILGAIALWTSDRNKRLQSRIRDEFLVDRHQFDGWLERWNSINNPPAKMLPRPLNNLPAPPNSEVTAYSFDRVVVCDSAEIAQMLIRNNFHFEHNCAILTIDGYPQSIFATTLEMLARNPDLKVYALHNCSPHGLRLVRRLRESETWFPNPAIPIIDVGIVPRQILAGIDILTLQSPESARIARALSADLRSALAPEELAWLDAGCYLELESFPPQKLIQILQRAINDSRELSTIDDGGGMVIIDDSPGFYTVESFG